MSPRNTARKPSVGEPEFEHNDVSKTLHDPTRVDKELSQFISVTAVDLSPERNKELLRKIDKHVMPVAVITCLLQALTQSTLPFASIMGLVEDTGMRTANGSVSQEYSWLTTSVYIVMLVAEYPQNYIISKVPLGKYLGFCLFAEGILVGSHAASMNFTGLLIGRCLLGVFEAAAQPCLVLLCVMWYRREEQIIRMTLWYMMSGAQQIFGGVLAYCFMFISHGPLHTWQWWFIFFGILLASFGGFVMYWLPDSPMRAKCFTDQEKRDMIERLRDNQTGIQNRTFKYEQAIEALLDPQVWAYCVINFCTTLPTAGLASFANIIIKSFGYSAKNSQLLAMPLGLYIIIILLSSAWLARRTRQSIWVMLGFLTLSFVGTALLMTLPNESVSQRIGLIICYYITFSFWSTTALGLSLLSRNIAGQTKKTITLTMTFIMWAVGNAIGPQVFLAWDGPRYYIAFATHLGCYSLLTLTIVSLRWYLKRQNMLRDNLALAGIEEANKQDTSRSFDDLTDRENLSFRYVY
ncbi:major facilitator superfamily domain-containing protein [Mariannaea sp. PMI_226]|nr:major facilitator superfamily domain-containing protein [Mariannaea sp. PMI_226]